MSAHAVVRVMIELSAVSGHTKLTSPRDIRNNRHPKNPASTFNLNYAIGALASPMIGGTAHYLGPVIGALLLSTLQQVVTVTISSEINVLVVGVLLVVFVVAAPEGILGLVKKHFPGKK